MDLNLKESGSSYSLPNQNYAAETIDIEPSCRPEKYFNFSIPLPQYEALTSRDDESDPDPDFKRWIEGVERYGSIDDHASISYHQFTDTKKTYDCAKDFYLAIIDIGRSRIALLNETVAEYAKVVASLKKSIDEAGKSIDHLEATYREIGVTNARREKEISRLLADVTAKNAVLEEERKRLVARIDEIEATHLYVSDSAVREEIINLMDEE